MALDWSVWRTWGKPMFGSSLSADNNLMMIMKNFHLTLMPPKIENLTINAPVTYIFYLTKDYLQQLTHATDR